MTRESTGYTTIIEALENLQQRGELEFESFSDDWIIRFWHGNQTHFLYANKLDINSHAATDIATDKVGTFQLLQNQHVPAVPHYLLTTPLQPQPDLDLLESLFARHRELVIKPTHGGRGQFVARYSDIRHALLAMKDTSVPSWSASPWVDVRQELRLVIRNGELKLAYEKYDPPTIHRLKMFNLHLGTKAKRLEASNLDESLVRIAQNAMGAIGLNLGAVDIIVDQQGQPQVLEINSGFSLERYARLAPEHRREVVAFYEQTIVSLFHN